MIARVCVQSIKAYNEGVLDFKWIDLPTTTEDIEESIKSLTGEEWHIADFESEIIPFQTFLNHDIFKFNDLTGWLDVLSDNKKTAVKIILEAEITDNLEDAIELAEERSFYPEITTQKQLGKYWTEKHFEQEGIELPFWICIDYETTGKELSSDYIITPEGTLQC